MKAIAIWLLLLAFASAQVSFEQSADTSLGAIIDAWHAADTAQWKWGATAGDLDGDGDSDVVLTGHNDSTAPRTIICRNNFVPSGTLSFTDVTATACPVAASLPWGNKPHVWDVDGDGDLDLVCGEKGKTLLNNGSMVFTSNGQTLRGVERGIVMGDFNMDGKQDYYTVIKGYSRGRKDVYMNGANGVFAKVQAPVFADPLPRAGTLGTRTNDSSGKLILKEGHCLVSGQTVDVTWASGSRLGMVTTVNLDLSAVNVTVSGGMGDVLPAVSTALSAVMLADPFYDALPASVRTRFEASVAANNYATGYNRYRGVDYLDQDINNDGRVDVLIWFEGSYSGDAWFYLCLRQLDGSLVEVNAASGLPVDDCRPLSATDVNGDGLHDILITPGGVAKSGLWIQAADGTFTNSANPGIADFIKASAPYTPHEVWEDFDNDGDPDLAISMLRNGVGKVWENAAGVFTEKISCSHWDADGMQVRSRAGVKVDFNADGLTDVLSVGTGTHSSTGPAICWLNTSAPPPPPPPPGLLRVKVNGIELPQGTTVKIDGVLVPVPTQPGDKIVEVDEP